MSILYVAVGCSGAGKSTFYRHLKDKLPNTFSVEPDEIRRERGNVNDQSNGSVVFSIAYSRARKHIENGEDVYFDATSLTPRAIKDVIKNVQADTVKILLFTDSEDWKECQRRVKSDIDAGKDRSRTFDVEIEGKPLQQIMSEKFIALKNNKEFWDWCAEKGYERLEV